MIDSHAVSMETCGSHVGLLTRVDAPCLKPCHVKDKDVTQFTVLTEKGYYNGKRRLKDKDKNDFLLSPTGLFYWYILSEICYEHRSRRLHHWVVQKDDVG
jgi:hypothetical protein